MNFIQYPASSLQFRYQLRQRQTSFLYFRFSEAPFVKIPFSFRVVDARIDARPGSSKLVFSSLPLFGPFKTNRSQSVLSNGVSKIHIRVTQEFCTQTHGRYRMLDAGCSILVKDKHRESSIENRVSSFSRLQLHYPTWRTHSRRSVPSDFAGPVHHL